MKELMDGWDIHIIDIFKNKKQINTKSLSYNDK